MEKTRILAPAVGCTIIGPEIEMSLVISGSADCSPMTQPVIGQSSLIFGKLNTILSVSEAEPAAHSPAIVPEAVLLFAAMIASRNVQRPSLATVSELLLTKMVLAAAERIVSKTTIAQISDCRF